jgi:plastocyanin
LSSGGAGGTEEDDMQGNGLATARRRLWLPIVVFFAATFVFAPIRIAYKHGDDGGGKPGSVVLSNFMFKPSTLTVAKGTKVVFKNIDVARHTITADDGSFDSGALSPGQSFDQVVNATVTYHCDYHANMKATIEVTG